MDVETSLLHIENVPVAIVGGGFVEMRGFWLFRHNRRLSRRSP